MSEHPAELERHVAPPTLVLKAPATVVASTRVRAARTEILSAPYVRKWALEEEALRLERRGEVHLLRRKPVWSDERGEWIIPVRRLKDPVPRWVKPAIITGSVLMTLSALCGAGAWLYATLGAVPLACLLLAALASFVGWVSAGFRRRRARVVNVNVNVSVRG